MMSLMLNEVSTGCEQWNRESWKVVRSLMLFSFFLNERLNVAIFF